MVNYRIKAHEKAIVGKIATHLILAFYKGDQLFAEYNGLSTLKGTPVAVGWPWELNDTIRVFREDRLFVGGSDIKKTVTPYTISSKNRFERFLDATDTVAELINSNHLPYQLLNQNSNSAFETRIQSIGLNLPNSATSGRPAPGRSNILLDAKTIQTIEDYSRGKAISAPVMESFEAVEAIGKTLDGFNSKYDVFISFTEITSIDTVAEA